MENPEYEVEGKTIQNMTPIEYSNGNIGGFMILFTDGTKMEISSRGFSDGSSECEADVSC